MSSHLEGPVGQSAYRVPRSPVDDYYVRGVQVEPVRSGTGVVVSIDGDTCTVLIGDEEIGGVVFLGDEPAVGDPVELELRGDLLVMLPDDYDYASYEEGVSPFAAHIVSDTDPGVPAPVELNVAGSMRSLDAWYFDAATVGWHTALDASGIGIRAFQRAAAVQSRNLAVPPSFEGGLTGWTAVGATLTQTTDQVFVGASSMRIDWTAGAQGLAQHAAWPELAVGTAYTIDAHMLVPQGSPSPRLTFGGVVDGPLVTTRDVWEWVSLNVTPAAGQPTFYGITLDEPAPANVGAMVYVDGLMIRKAGEPLPPGLTYFDGSLPAMPGATFAWEAGVGSISRWYDGVQGAPGTGTLWSTEPFAVNPGDKLDLSAVLDMTAGAAATAQMVVCYSPTTADPIPGGAGMVTQTYGAAVPVNAAGVALVAQAVVPATIAVDTPPVTAIVGVRLVGPGTSDLLLRSLQLMYTAGAWALGTLWLNPVPGQALPTVGVTAMSGTSSGGALTGPASSYTRIPAGKKALVTAPPDTGGLVWVMSTGGVVGQTTNNTAIEFMHHADVGAGAVATGQISRMNSMSLGGNFQFPLCVLGTVVLDAGQTAEIYLAYRYPSDPGSGVQSIRGHAMTVVFIPTGVAAGASAGPAPVSFWDGDSWAPGSLAPAKMDLTKDAITVEPGKTPTTIVVGRSPPSPVTVGTPITITATVTPSAATGTVTFYRGPTATGAWTSLGSVALVAGKASKVWTPTTAGVYYFRAVYSGDTLYQGKEGVSSAITVQGEWTTQTKTFNAQWVMPYNGSGSQKGGGSFAGDTYCGYYDSQTGNQKTLIQFLPNLPADADVSKVELICDDWDFWRTNKGGLVAGWHENRGGSAPGSWTKTHGGQSEHSPGEGSWTVNLTSWADTKVTRSDFGGITIGPGANNSDLYNGNCLGKGNWHLRVTYRTQT